MKTFKNSNVLFLFPVDGNQYLERFYKTLGQYCGALSKFNSVAYFALNGLERTENKVMELIRDNKIDVVISSPYATDYHLTVEFYAEIRKSAFLLFWMFDDENYFDAHSKYYCQVADAVVTNDYFGYHNYLKLAIPAIFSVAPFDADKYHPVKTEKDIDVCFLGDCTKNGRMEFINHLTQNGVKVETFGKGSKNGFVDLESFSSIFSRSLINLNFTKLDSLSWINRCDPLLNRVRQNKGRPVEAALTRSFCLSEYSPGLEHMFKTGFEIDTFVDKNELLSKVKYYLANRNEAERLAENAFQRARKDYLFEPVMSQTVAAIEELAAKPAIREDNNIYLSDGFKYRTINCLTFFTFMLLKNLKPLYALRLSAHLFKYGIFIFLKGFSQGSLRALKVFLTNKRIKE
jgi:spore maturation protein CgeB